MKRLFIRSENPGLRSNNVLVCQSCGKILCSLGKLSASSKLVLICRCGQLNVFNGRKHEVVKGSAAVRVRNAVLCPVCGHILINFREENLSGISFRVYCTCGNVYDKAKPINKKERKLGNFTSLM